MRLTFTHNGREYEDNFTFVEASELSSLIEKNGLGEKEGFSGSWYGNCTAAQARQRVVTGDPSLVAASDELLSRLENHVPHTKKFQWQRTPAGPRFNVGEAIAGIPDCMRRRVRTDRNDAPVTIFMDLTSSAMVSASDLLKRGTAILALARVLTEHRAVELWGGIALGDSSGWSGANVAWSSTLAWRIDTAPLDLARAAFLLSHPAMARGIGYGLAPACAGHKSWGGNWPWGAQQLHVQTQQERMRNAMGAAEMLVIPPIYGTDPLVKDPEGWITRELARLTDPDAARVGSESWNERRDRA